MRCWSARKRWLGWVCLQPNPPFASIWGFSSGLKNACPPDCLEERDHRTFYLSNTILGVMLFFCRFNTQKTCTLATWQSAKKRVYWKRVAFFKKRSHPQKFLENRVKKQTFVGQKVDFRGQKTDFRGQKTDFRGQKSDFRGQKSDFRVSKIDFPTH